MTSSYALVATSVETLGLQFGALDKASCDRISTATASRAKADRRVLADVRAYLRASITRVIRRFDPLRRARSHWIATLADLAGRTIGVREMAE